MIQEGAWWIEGSTYSSFVRSHNKLHQNQDWIKKRSGHDVSSTYMLEVFRGKDQISNYNLLMHSPVGSGTLTRKKDWVKDLCTFSIIYFIGKWMLTISKARDYELFSFFVYLDFFFRDYLFLKKIKKNKSPPPQSLLGKKDPFALLWLSKCYLLSCLTTVPSPVVNILLPPCICKTFSPVKALGHFVIPLGFPFIHCFLR